MLNFLPFALLLEVFARVGASPVDTTLEAAHPMITQRAELYVRQEFSTSGGFIGYYYTNDTSGNVYITSSDKSGSVATFRDSTLVDYCSDNSQYLADTCPSAYWTSCDGATLMSQGGSSSCPGTCDYDIVYTGSESDTSSKRWYHCMDRAYLSFYGEVPPGTLLEDMTFTSDFSSSETSSSESTSDSFSTETSASPASTGTTLASQTSDPTSSATSTPTAEPAKEKEASKAWIAGVVIGIVGLLAVAGMGFFLWRRRKAHAYGPAPQGPPQAPMQPGYPPQQTAYYAPPQAFGTGPSPYLPPVSPNMSAYDAQNAKPQENTMYGGYAPQQYGGPPPGVGTVQMPQASPQVQPQVAANMHELPELASSGR